MGVNEKMREALEIIAAIADKYAGEYPTQIGSIAREALAQPPVVVELTDAEILGVATRTQSAEPGRDGYVLPFTFARAVIAAHEAKRAGGV